MTDSKSPDDGGYAFPQALRLQHEYVGSNGMTLRDYFAGQALSAVSAHNWPIDQIADTAYRIADAMLTERVK